MARFPQMPGALMVQGFAMFSVVEKARSLDGPGRPVVSDGWIGTEVGYPSTPTRAARVTPPKLPRRCGQRTTPFDTLGWDEGDPPISPENTASQAVAQRLVLRNRGSGKLPPLLDAHAIDIWGQTRAEWADNRKRFA